MPALSPVPPKIAVPSDPWILRHRHQVLLALAAAATAVVLSALVVSKLKKAEQRSWEQLSMASSHAAQGNSVEALKALEGMLASQRSEPLAVQGLILRSGLFLGQENKTDALAAAREAVRQAASPQYKALADGNLAYVLEEAGEPAEAAEAYARFIKDHPEHFLTGRSYFQLGRLQAGLGKRPEAKAVFEKLVTLYPSTVWARDAKAALEEQGAGTGPK